jgi:hypothetical protein
VYAHRVIASLMMQTDLCAMSTGAPSRLSLCVNHANHVTASGRLYFSLLDIMNELEHMEHLKHLEHPEHGALGIGSS